MKMHPKPVRRHTQHVELFTITENRYDACLPDNPFVFKFRRLSDGATQGLFMTREEALQLFENLGVMLRFEDTKAKDVESEALADCYHHLKQAINRGET